MGHFNEELEVLPGVKQVESAAQLGAYMVMAENPGETIPLFAGISDVKFPNPVFPGDTLTLIGETIERNGSGFIGMGRVMVENTVTCEMVMSAAIFPNKLGIRVVNRNRRGPVKIYDSENQTWVEDPAVT
jgi:3-hydroxymyristoyl/3-hydroxydecanoyl-(acyl carrier protein) dehydratase